MSRDSSAFQAGIVLYIGLTTALAPSAEGAPVIRRMRVPNSGSTVVRPTAGGASELIGCGAKSWTSPSQRLAAPAGPEGKGSGLGKAEGSPIGALVGAAGGAMLGEGPGFP